MILTSTIVDDVRKNILRKEIGRTEAIKRRNKIREKLSAEFEDVTVRATPSKHATGKPQYSHRPRFTCFAETL